MLSNFTDSAVKTPGYLESTPLFDVLRCRFFARIALRQVHPILLPLSAKLVFLFCECYTQDRVTRQIVQRGESVWSTFPSPNTARCGNVRKCCGSANTSRSLPRWTAIRCPLWRPATPWAILPWDCSGTLPRSQSTRMERSTCRLWYAARRRKSQRTPP